MPSDDSQMIGHKYPFNACEILCSQNGLNINKLLNLKDEDVKEEEKEKEKEENEENDNKKDNENDDKKDESIDGKKEEENDDKKDESIDGKKEEINDEIKEEKKEEKSEEKIGEKVEEKPDQKQEEKLEEKVEEKTEQKVGGKPEEKSEEKKEEKLEEKPEEKKEEKLEEKVEKKIQQKSEEKVEEKQEENIAKKKEEKQEEKVDEKIEVKIEIKEEENKEKNDEEIKEDEDPTLKITYNIFDYLFKFLDVPPSDDNYVLMGYFAKIINSLLKDKSDILLVYIFSKRPFLIKKFMNHINRKAIGNIIETFIMNLNDNSYAFSNDYIIIICKNLIDEIEKVEIDERGIEVICDTLINSMISYSKNNFLMLLTTENLFENLLNNIEKFMKEKQDSKVTCLLKLIIKINENLLKDFETKVTKNFSCDETENEIINIIRSIDRGGSAYDANQKDFNFTSINVFKQNPERIIKLIDKSVEIVINDIMSEDEDKKEEVIINCYSEKKHKKFGVKSLYEWEYLRTVIDIYVNCYANDEQKENIDLSIKKIIDSKILSKMIRLYFDYAFTNMYTNIFDGLISIIICENTPPYLVKATFEIEEDNSKNLISLLVNDLIKNPKFTYESSNNSTCSILFSNHCDLLKQIFQSKHPNILEIIEKDKNIKFFNDDFITKISDKFSKKLLAEELDEGAKNDYMSPLYDIDSSTKKETEVKLSKYSINQEIDLHFKIYDKFIKGENYQDLLKEDEEEKKVEEEERIDRNINEKTDEKMEESPIFEARNSGMENEQNKIEENENDNNDEYNDSNYWKVSFDQTTEDEILKDLE